MTRPAVSRETIAAARLVDPSTRDRIDVRESVDWEAVLRILLANKVALAGMPADPTLAACPLLALSSFRDAEARDARVRERQRAEYAKARERLLQRGIESVLFKSTGLAPSFPHTSGNLDTLVAAEHVEAAREILCGLGYVELRNIEEPDKYLFRLFDVGESVSAIHLHATVGWGVPFLDDAALWRRARPSEDDPLVTVPGPEDAILVTLAHTFYEDKAIRLLDVAGIRRSLRAGRPDLAEVERVAHERGWEDGLALSLALFDRFEDLLYGERSLPPDALEWARGAVRASGSLSRRFGRELDRGEAAFPFRVSFPFVKLLYYRKVVRDRERGFSTKAADVVRTVAWGVKLKARIRGQRGFAVSFSGIDGSGKSMRVRALARAFEIAEIDARTEWRRFGSAPGRGPAEAGAPASEASVDTGTSLERRRSRLRHPFVAFAWLAWHVAGIVCAYHRRVRGRRWLRGVVICDRYVYDAAVEIDASLPHNPRLSLWAGRILGALCPRPDVAWLLDVPASLGVERQRDERHSQSAREELSRQRSEYLNLAQAHGMRVVQTIGSAAEVTNRIVRETLVAYYDDYHTWVNTLFLSNPDQMNPKRRAR